MNDNPQTPLLTLDGIGKEYYGNKVLENVSFSLNKGEILGLVGENGAGKSTLMKILFGMSIISETGGYLGRILLNGKEVKFRTSFDALDAGIGMVHQEFSLIPGFTAAENILLNHESTKYTPLAEAFGDRMNVLDRLTMEKRARSAIGRLGVNLDPTTEVSQMPVGHKQFTEIAREIGRENTQVLVLDEPTAVLTESEAKILLSCMKNLAAEGIAIIFITHRLQEILDVCDRLVVLRDGHIVKQAPTAGTSIRDIAGWMVGRSTEPHPVDPNHVRTIGEPLLQVRNLWVDMPGETVRDLSLEVRTGEILGIGGLAGQGKLGFPNGLMGLFPAGGEVIFQGAPLRLEDPKGALEAGLAFVSEDRRGVGLLLAEPIDWNMGFTAQQIQGAFSHPLLGGLIRWRSDKALAENARTYVDQLAIKCRSTRQHAGELSGGNQQKVCLAKAFTLKPKLLLVSEPTRGIDIGAKKLVLDTIRRFNREEGGTVIMISSELEELRLICDRIAIVGEGKVSGIVAPDAPAEEIGLLMSGITPGVREVGA